MQIRIKLNSIAAAAFLASYSGAAPTRPPTVEGSYVVQTLNGRTLPAELRVPATQGDVRLIKLEQGVLRLTNQHRFVLYFRYYHQLVRHGKKPIATPVLSDSETGTYAINTAGQLVLNPAKKKGARSRPTIAASLVGSQIKAAYELDTGTTREHITLVLQRDASFW